MKRKTTFLKTITFVFAFFIGYLTYAQQRTCGVDSYMQEQMKNPEFAQENLRIQGLIDNVKRNTTVSNKNSRPIVIVPVAVHFPDGSEGDRACLEALAQNQIDILNNDYAGTNTDISLWSGASANYPGTNTGSAEIFFCLATMNHPVNTDNDLVEGGPAVTIGWSFGGGNDSDGRWSGYLNFLVKDAGTDILGYSPQPGSIAAGQSVVISNDYGGGRSAFGSGTGCTGYAPGPGPYNLGRTVTHELGHFFGVPHTFTGFSCGADDGFSDTPNIDSDTGGCPNPGTVAACTAGESSLTMNYMDYVNDACMYMFTEQQAAQVDSYIAGVMGQFNTNVTACTVAPDFGFNIANNTVSACPSSGSVDFNLNYFTTGGFNENTTFSQTGAPAGSMVTFSPMSQTGNGPVVMTIDDIDGVALGDYPITITGTANSFSRDFNVTLSLVNSPCTSAATNVDDDRITRVIFNTINNVTLDASADDPYQDFTAISTDVERDSSHDITVHVNSNGAFFYVNKVWIDWNQNCSFDDAGEEYDLGTANNVVDVATSNSPLTIVVPANAVLGTTTMRVGMKNTDNVNNDFGPCESAFWGQVEDYSINVLPSLSVDEFDSANIAIFPNPNNGEFTLNLNSTSNQDISVIVFDIRGREVYTNTFLNTSNFNQTVNLGNVQSGIYLLKVSDGFKSITKKIIVE